MPELSLSSMCIFSIRHSTVFLLLGSLAIYLTAATDHMQIKNCYTKQGSLHWVYKSLVSLPVSWLFPSLPTHQFPLPERHPFLPTSAGNPPQCLGLESRVHDSSAVCYVRDQHGRGYFFAGETNKYINQCPIFMTARD